MAWGEGSLQDSGAVVTTLSVVTSDRWAPESPQNSPKSFKVYKKQTYGHHHPTPSPQIIIISEQGQEKMLSLSLKKVFSCTTPLSPLRGQVRTRRGDLEKSEFQHSTGRTAPRAAGSRRGRGSPGGASRVPGAPLGGPSPCSEGPLPPL